MTPIVYGMPGPELLEASQRDEIIIGGCCVEPELPLFECRTCGRTAGRLGDEWDTHFENEDWS